MTTADAFRQFVERVQGVGDNKLHRFRDFAEAASERVLADLKGSAAALSAAVRPSAPWIGEHDLLAFGGLTFVENAYTRLLAWALDPMTNDSTALDRQRAWLAHVGIDRWPTTAATPALFLSTSRGIPDLVLAYKDFIVVVEAKTMTDEHTTPGGQLQSHAYGPAVAQTLGRTEGSVDTVYLTLDRSPPDNHAARPVSYLGSLLAIIASIDVGILPDDVQAGFRTIVTHFAANADRPRRDLRRTIRRLDVLLADSVRLAPDELRDLLALRTLMGETK